MIVAHPDDELIFGGAELIKRGPEYKVVCITNGSNDIRRKEFEESMNKLKVGSFEMWDYEDTLYPEQAFDLNDFSNLINSKKWGKIVTHNPIGEYGHPQHKFIFDAVKKITRNFYVFNKSNTKLDKDLINLKKELLTIYKSEAPIIEQLLTKNGDWFKSNSNTNYIEYETITKYNPKKDVTPYIACYEK